MPHLPPEKHKSQPEELQASLSPVSPKTHFLIPPEAHAWAQQGKDSDSKQSARIHPGQIMPDPSLPSVIKS